MGRTKGATNKTNKKNSSEMATINKTVVKTDNTPTETKRKKTEREPSIIIPLDSKYRIKWDKLNKQLQVKMEKINTENQDDIDEEEDVGYRTLGFFSTWQHLGKNYIEELIRKKMLKVSKDGVTDINKLIEVANKIENKVIKLFGQLDFDDSKIETK